MNTGLNPISPTLVPFTTGEVVAFSEEHSDHPGKYGIIEGMGTDESGELKLDLRVFDPFAGVTEEDTTIHRTGLEEIQ